MQVAINSGKGLSNGLDHKINYVARLSNNAYGINGNSWLIRTLPYLSFSTVLVDDHAQDVVMVQDQKLSTRFRWNGSGYDGLFGTRRQLTIAGGEYWVTDSRGKCWQFYGPDVVEGLRGKLQRWIDPDGVESVASYDGSQRIVSLERTLPGTQHSAGLYYTFATSGVHEGRITRVEKRISRDGVAQPVRRWDYSYHTGADSAGSANDLKTAEVFVYNMQTAAWESLGTSYYRYYKADSAIGFVHGLKYIVGPEDYARLVLAGLPPENVDAVPDEVLASYATEYREYDDQHRTTKVVLRGGTLETEFNRLNSEGSGRNWNRKSVKMRADGAEIVTYFNKVNQPVLRILKKDALSWSQYYEYNEQYKIVLQAGPDAISSFAEPASPSENFSVSLYSTKGLNKLWVYYPMSGGDAGSAPGYLKTEAVRKGTGGTVVKLREFTYTSYTEGDETIYRVASRSEYRNSSGGGTNPATTNFVYEWRLGTFQPLQITTTLPVVSLDENGSGETYERTERLDLFGNLNWNRDEIGVLTYQTFDGLTGGIVQRIEDVNTLRMSPEVVPFGWSTPPDGGHHLINDFLTDNHGRVTQEAGPLHSVDLNGVATEVRRAAFHVYLDGRRQRWQASGYLIGDGARTLGPVRIQQRNHSGRITDTVHASYPVSPAPSELAMRFGHHGS